MNDSVTNYLILLTRSTPPKILGYDVPILVPLPPRNIGASSPPSVSWLRRLKVKTRMILNVLGHKHNVQVCAAEVFNPIMEKYQKSFYSSGCKLICQVIPRPQQFLQSRVLRRHCQTKQTNKKHNNNNTTKEMFVTKNNKVALKRAVGFIVFSISKGGWIHKDL